MKLSKFFAAGMVLISPCQAVIDATLTTSGANPIRRVVTLLEKMAKKVDAEGKTEKELYDKYMCYCQTGGAELAQSIADSTAKVPQLQSDIESAESQLLSLEQDLKSHQEDRATAKAAITSATAQREGEHKEFVATSTEYKSFLTALAGAIPAIQKGMAGGFLQAGAAAHLKLVQSALSSSTSITDYDRRMVAAFISGTSSDLDGYVPKGGEIVGILKQIEEEYKKSLAEVESTEKGAVKVFEELITAKTKQVQTLTDAIEKKTARVGELKVEIVTMKNDLSDSEAALIQDQKFAAEMKTSCGTKTTEWEERQKTRAEELIAIHETIKILNDDDALELFKKTLPTPSFVQLQASMEQLRNRALSYIRALQARPATDRTGLDFLALALEGHAVDFTKVIKMIDDMVALLKLEQADDDNKQEYCKAQLDTVEDKAKELAAKIEDLKTSIADKGEAISTYASEIKKLTSGITALDKSVSEATEQRKKEHEEYMTSMSSNSAASQLLAFAKNKLNSFYNPKLHKAPPKRELTEEEKTFTSMGGTLAPTAAPGGIAGTGISALVQISKHNQADEVPPPPATWNAYAKKSEESSGVLSLMDLLIKDLAKEMTEAQTEEKDAQADYEKMMEDAAKKRAADLKAIAAKETAKANAEEGKTLDEASATSESKQLTATKMYEMELHQECDWLLQNFDLRKQARAEEMDSLKQAKAVLSGADFSFAQHSW